jgi:trk system potassium uptake protein
MIRLHRLLELPLLVVLLGVCAALMLAPAAYALALYQFHIARSFFYASCIVLVITAMIGLATAGGQSRDAPQNQLVAVISAYVILPLVLAVPMQQSMPQIGFADAWFEMLSAFTTTGATVFDAPDLVPHPVHFWRALVGWMGGFFSLVVTVSVLAPRGFGGVELLGVRASAQSGESGQSIRNTEPAHQFMHFCAVIFPAYAAVTLGLWICLLIAGDTALAALMHAMGTVSASGISPMSGLQNTGSGLWGEGLILVVMVFAVTRVFWPATPLSDRTRNPWHDPELRLAGLIVGVVVIFLMAHRLLLTPGTSGFQSVPEAFVGLWAAVFTSLSFLTTIGFQSSGWQGLGAPGLVLLGLVIIGGGIATTAGGIKLLRVYALLRHGERELERIIHPRSVGGHGPVARRLRRQGAYIAWIFFMLFGLLIAAVVAALTLSGLGFLDALVFGIASLSSTGQLTTMMGDVPLTYGELSLVQREILGVAMIFGRLEIFAVFAAFGALTTQRSW